MKYNIEKYINHRKYTPITGYTDGILYEIDSHAKTLNGVIRAIGKNTNYFNELEYGNLQMLVFNLIACNIIVIYDDKIIIYS